jgi:VWFA-related protein
MDMRKGFRLLLTLSFMLMALSFLSAQEKAQGTEPQASPSGMTIKAESRLVLVDTVVTNKHGEYVHDLTAKDFRVYEDGKEQAIKSFLFEADAAAPVDMKKHYMVLFFDNSSMDPAEQKQARDAAVKFIDANAGPDRLMAIVNFSGSLHVAQTFTSDAERLKKIAAGESISNVASNADFDANGEMLTRAELDYGQYTMLLALRSLARRLEAVPGRKMLVLLSSGFKLDSDQIRDLSRAIDACNKSNVAVYPVDTRGLVAPNKGELRRPRRDEGEYAYNGATLRLASFSPPQPSVFTQKGGKGGTGGKPTGGTVVQPGRVAPAYPPPDRFRNFEPKFPPSSLDNQHPLYALAIGTGGFVIANTNDLLSGMEKIAAEQNQYYLLGYTPAAMPDGTCHSLKVKVDRGDTIVRARTGYCSTKPVDMLAGNLLETQLEALATGSSSGTVQTALTAPFFYTGPKLARVNVTMNIQPDAMNIEKKEGKYFATGNVLGVAVDKQGQVAARFSDSLKVELEGKQELQQFKKQPYHYEKEFDVPAGDFRLTTVFKSDGEGFGKAEIPLVIDAHDSQQFSISGVALSNKIVQLSAKADENESALLEDRTPLVVNHMQIVPSATNNFTRTEMSVFYVEVYEPLLASPRPPEVVLIYRVFDKKSGSLKFDSGMMNLAPSIIKGNPVIPVGMKLVTDRLLPGEYRLEVQAKDSIGKASAVRTAEFKVE